MPLSGRLGLDTARIPHTDRHGLMWLGHGRLTVEGGTLVFSTAGTEHLRAGVYEIAYQNLSVVLLGPGSTVSHDALRLMARHETGLLAVGADGVRLYAVSMPFGPDRSERARRHARLWADEARRMDVVRRFYALRIGGPLPEYYRDLDSLRGMEGARMKETYRQLARHYGLAWQGRRYDRMDPDKTNRVNQAINHAATAVYAAARIAVAVSGAIPQLGFIHEDSGHAFALDIADLYRTDLTLPVAFEAARASATDRIEHETRTLMGRKLRSADVIARMIDRIKETLDDAGSDA